MFLLWPMLFPYITFNIVIDVYLRVVHNGQILSFPERGKK